MPIGIECRCTDMDTQALIEPLHDRATGLCVVAERSMSATLEGGCDIPLAAHATLHDGEIRLAGLVASVDGRRIVRDSISGPSGNGIELGRQLGEALLAAGAAGILDELHSG